VINPVAERNTIVHGSKGGAAVSCVKHSSSLIKATVGIPGVKIRERAVIRVERSAAEHEEGAHTEARNAFVFSPVVARGCTLETCGKLTYIL